MTLASRLEHVRVLAGLSARELGDLAGVASGYVSLLEAETRRHPRADKLAQVAAILGCPLEWIIQGVGDPPTKEQIVAAVAAARARIAAAAAATHAPTGTDGC